MDTAGLLLLLRVALSLACVVGLIWIAGRKLSGAQTRHTPAGPTMRVVGRQALGRHSGVAVVSVGNRRLLLGYGEQQITMLTELSPVAEPATAPAPAPAPARAFAFAAVSRAAGLLRGPVAPETLLTGLPTPREPLDIDALLVQARLDADHAGVPASPARAVAHADATTKPAPTASGPVSRGVLDGSILSSGTWRRALETLQDRTVRR
jgi:flagellar protein FliO/FliZ